MPNSGEINILGMSAAVAIDGSEWGVAVQGGTTRRFQLGLVMAASASQSVQAANTVFAGPTTGTAAAPSFRALVAADIPASAINIAVGTTPIASGTSTRVLYDNAGVLGEYAISGTGDVAMTNSPTLVTPALGTPSAAVLTNATGLPLTTGVTGTLPVGNGGTGVTSLGTLSRVDDTNVTLTLGGTPANALIQSVSLTLGWSGTLSGARGGTGVANTGKTITVAGNTTIGSNTDTVAFVTGGATSVTLPTTGTLATLAGAESLSNKTLVSPIITTAPTAAGATWANLGTVTTVALAAVTGSVDMSSATFLKVPNSNAPTVNADGQVAIDNSVADFAQGIITYYSTAQMGVVAMPIAQFGSPANGAVPTYNAATDRFELNVAAGSGDVVGPGSATDNAMVRFDGTTGKLIQNSGVIVDDSNNVSGVGTLASAAHTITSTGTGALAVGANGATNPVLSVNANTASVATGITIIGAAAAGRVNVAVISSGTDEGLSLNAKGTGTIRLGPTSTGAIEFSRNAVPTSSDGAALGTTSLMWADLFLADGGVVNWNSGNVTLTHSSGLLTSSAPLTLGTSNAFTCGTIELGAASDTTISRSAAGVIAVEGVPLYSNIPVNSQSAAYTTVLADAQKFILHPAADNNARTFTIDSNANVAYPIGTALTFVNEINTVTIAIASDTLVLAGPGTTGSRTLAAMGVATAIKKTSTSWIISGAGLT